MIRDPTERGVEHWFPRKRRHPEGGLPTEGSRGGVTRHTSPGSPGRLGSLGMTFLPDLLTLRVYPARRIEMPAALARAAALSVFSQLKLPSLPGLRPKWPWRAVCL